MPDGKKEDSKRHPSKPQDQNEIGLWRLVNVGVEWAGTVGVCLLLGWLVDRQFGWAPWGMVAGGLLGIVVGLYHFLKDALK